MRIQTDVSYCLERPRLTCSLDGSGILHETQYSNLLISGFLYEVKTMFAEKPEDNMPWNDPQPHR